MQLPLDSFIDVIQICHMALVGSSSFLPFSTDIILIICLCRALLWLSAHISAVIRQLSTTDLDWDWL
jgi:hypothetical protein